MSNRLSKFISKKTMSNEWTGHLITEMDENLSDDESSHKASSGGPMRRDASYSIPRNSASRPYDATNRGKNSNTNGLVGKKSNSFKIPEWTSTETVSDMETFSPSIITNVEFPESMDFEDYVDPNGNCSEYSQQLKEHKNIENASISGDFLKNTVAGVVLENAAEVDVVNVAATDEAIDSVLEVNLSDSEDEVFQEIIFRNPSVVELVLENSSVAGGVVVENPTQSGTVISVNPTLAEDSVVENVPISNDVILQNSVVAEVAFDNLPLTVEVVLDNPHLAEEVVLDNPHVTEEVVLDNLHVAEEVLLDNLHEAEEVVLDLVDLHAADDDVVLADLHAADDDVVLADFHAADDDVVLADFHGADDDVVLADLLEENVGENPQMPVLVVAPFLIDEQNEGIQLENIMGNIGAILGNGVFLDDDDDDSDDELDHEYDFGMCMEDISMLPCRRFLGSSDVQLCGICLGPYEPEDHLRTLPCFHEFHSDCLDPWLMTKASCPKCREKVSWTRFDEM